jgi:hypothetical protein
MISSSDPLHTPLEYFLGQDQEDPGCSGKGRDADEKVGYWDEVAKWDGFLSGHEAKAIQRRLTKEDDDRR